MSYVPNTKEQQKEMLSAVGAASFEDLFQDIPKEKRLKKEVPLPLPLSEQELLEELTRQSQKNKNENKFLGGGSYNHFIPSAVKHLVNRAEFYTAYTPYQAEISQGILQAIYEYQSMICRLTGMDAANASMYDGATALAEAALLACRVTKRSEIVVSSAVNPEYRQVLKTYARAADLKVIEIAFEKSGQTKPLDLSDKNACFILQQPNFFGCLERIKDVAEKVHAKGALFIVSIDPLSLGILKPPGKYGADIVVGEGQPLGIPRSFGGPGLGIFAVKKALVRQLPGRLSGATVDKNGKRGFVLTLQAREQHIRREKAPSNICSNEALCALSAIVYLSLLGKNGLKQVAGLCLQKSNYLRNKIKNNAFSASTFKEFVVKSKKKIPAGLSLGEYYPELKDHYLICVTELNTKTELDQLAGLLA